MKIFVAIALLLAIGACAFYWFSGDFPFGEETRLQIINEDPHPQIDSLIALMNQALRTRHYEEGKQLASNIIKLSQQNEYRYGEAWATAAIGFVLNHQAKYDSSIILFESSRSLAKKYHLDPVIYHNIGSHLANSYDATGNYEKALSCFQEALNYFTEVDSVYYIAAVLNNMGLLYQSRGMYAKAQEIFEKGLTYAKQIPDDRYYVRSFTGNLGILYQDLGQFDKAIPLIEASLQIGQEMNDRTAQAIDLNHLGSINSARGNFRGSIEKYLEAVRLAEEIGENKTIISAYKNIGRIYDALNNFEKAEFYYRKCIDLIDTKLAGNYDQFPWPLQSFGEHWIRRGDYSKAENYLAQALEGYQKLELPLERALAHMALARLRFKQEKYAECIQNTETAFGILEGIQAAPLYGAEGHLLLGSAYCSMGEEDSMIVHLKNALELSGKYKDSEIAWQAHYYLSRHFKDRNDFKSAVNHSKQAVAAIERLRQYTISPELGSSFLADKLEVYHQYFDILFDLYQQQPTEENLTKLFALSEQTRGRALLDNLKSGGRSVFFQLKESAALQNTEEQMAALNRLIREELVKPAEHQEKKLTQSWRKQLTELQQEYERSTTQFAAANPKLSTLTGISQRIKLEEIQQHLHSKTAIISYHIAPPNVYAFLITGNASHVKKLNVASTDLWKSIHSLRRPFQDFKDGKIDFLRLPFDGQLSQSLYQQLLAPLLPDIEAAERLIIVPAGVLNYLPFELLVSGRKESSQLRSPFAEYGEYRFMIQDYTISYLPSTALLPILIKEKPERAEETLLAFGDPITADEVTEIPQLAVNAPPSGLRLMAMTPLPGASLEVEGILHIFDQQKALGLIGREASEAIYKKQAERYRFIHLATHGYVDEQNPNFSALLLNPGNETEDGFLYIHEIYSHPLRAELVSLSACETALGKLQQGEGLISFVQAFFAAGSRNVMASLWSVEESTYPLMISFYKYLQKGFAEAEALRKAKLEFIKTESSFKNGVKYSNSHPFLWAPFVLYGVD